MTPFSSLKVAACLVVLAVFLCSRGEAQLCPNATVCDVNFTVIESFQQYNLDDNIKTCIRCLFNDTVFNDTTWDIEDPPISLTNEPDPLGTSNNGVLEICSTNPILDRTDDNGPRFICASATAGQNQTYTLFMTIRALNPPSITPVDEPLMVDEDTAELMLSCLHPDSQPVTLEQWTGPDGRVLSNQSTLILNNLTRDDTGLYTCTITDDRNDTRNSSRTIVVRHAPIVTTQDGDTAVQLFDMLVRSCEIEAIPNATMITWLLNDTVLPNGTDFQISSTAGGSMLIVSNISREGGGVYTCNATNDLGSGQNGTTVSIIVPPEMPGNVRVLNVAKTSVNIEWTIGLDGGSNVTAADVEVFFASSNSLFRAVDDQGAIDEDLQAAFIDDLSPFTEYTIRVYLVNNRISGRSEPGEINVTTLSECLAAPLNLSFTFDCSVITVTWEHPPFRVDTAPAANWTVVVEEVGGSMVSQESMTSDNGTTFMISTPSLTIGSSYTVRVAGVNEGGTGNFSESMFQVVDCPSAPQNVGALACSAFALTVSWEPPVAVGGSSVTGYTVSIESASISVTLMDPQQSSYFLSNLTGSTTYVVEVAAINSIGTGPTGSDQETTLSEDLPQPILSAPMAPNITQFSAVITAVITWVHPGGTVNTFFVQLTPVAGSGADVVTASTPDGTSTMLTVEGLLPEVMYTVSVVASNDNGNATSVCDTPAGTFITPVLTTMPTTVPTAAPTTGPTTGPTTAPSGAPPSALSTGAIIGIIVGIVVGAIVIVVLLIVIVILCRKFRKNDKDKDNGLFVTSSHPAELESHRKLAEDDDYELSEQASAPLTVASPPQAAASTFDPQAPIASTFNPDTPAVITNDNTAQSTPSSDRKDSVNGDKPPEGGVAKTDLSGDAPLADTAAPGGEDGRMKTVEEMTATAGTFGRGGEGGTMM